MALKRDYSEQEYTAPNAFSRPLGASNNTIAMYTQENASPQNPESNPKSNASLLIRVGSVLCTSSDPFNLMHCIVQEGHCHMLHRLVVINNQNGILDSCSLIKRFISPRPLNFDLQV